MNADGKEQRVVLTGDRQTGAAPAAAKLLLTTAALDAVHITGQWTAGNAAGAIDRTNLDFGPSALIASELPNTN